MTIDEEPTLAENVSCFIHVAVNNSWFSEEEGDGIEVIYSYRLHIGVKQPPIEIIDVFTQDGRKIRITTQERTNVHD